MATSDDVRENVKKYYGSRLESSGDLQTSAASCSLSCRPVPRSVTDALSLVHPEVTKRWSHRSLQLFTTTTICTTAARNTDRTHTNQTHALQSFTCYEADRFFGCGLPFPAKLEGCRVLDLGSGSGRDCYAFSKLVGPSGHVTGIDMTEELVTASRQYIEYHHKKFGYKEPNVSFVQGYMEKLSEAGIQSDSMDVVLSNCVICLCPDKRAVLQQAYNVLKEGGELYFSDMYASKVVPDHMKQDPVLWGEGMGGSLFWQDLISLAHSIGFSTPRLVSASSIVIYNSELKAKAGDINYASGTFRLFKLPKHPVLSEATVTYKGTVADFPDQLDFDSSHRFKKDVAVEVNGEMAAFLQSSRFFPDFEIQISDKPESSSGSTPQYCHLNPFLLADKLGSSVTKCSKTSK